MYTAPWQSPISNFDDTELLKIGWFTLGVVQGLADRGALHAGYEIDVVRLLARSEQGMRAAG